jgi:hypothetical protein
MDDFLLDCCFNAFDKGLKFGELTARYAKSTPRYAAYRRVSTPHYAASFNKLWQFTV